MALLPTREQLITFLNELPTMSIADGWIYRFRLAVADLFPEIDDIYFLNNLLDEKHRKSQLDLADMELVGSAMSSLGFTADALPPGMRERDEATIDRLMASNGHSREQYHPPVTFSYFDDGWLGTLVLLREIQNPPFTQEMLSTFAELEPFFIFAFKDHSIRHHAEHPADNLFYEAVQQITEQTGLTNQEMRVLMFRLLGRSYKEISGMLGISISTVKNHLNAVHSKSGVHSQSELFARYFAPTFGLFTQLAGDK